MAYTLVEYFSAVFSRTHQRKHDPYVPAKRIHDLDFRKIVLMRNPHTGDTVMNVTGTFTQPTTRKSGAPLANTDIDHFSLRRNGTEIQVFVPNANQPQISWTDASPLTGTDTYEVFTITKDGFISDPSNDAVVAVAAADPAAAVTDLKAQLNTP